MYIGKALIADEMGSGKTIQAIGVMQHYRQHWPVLIMMPVTLVGISSLYNTFILYLCVFPPPTYSLVLIFRTPTCSFD
jgi:hypothetical protein